MGRLRTPGSLFVEVDTDVGVVGSSVVEGVVAGVVSAISLKRE